MLLNEGTHHNDTEEGHHNRWDGSDKFDDGFDPALLK